MKKLICILTVVIISVCLTLSVHAENDYVYKEPDYGYSSPVKYLDSTDGRYSYVIDSEGKAYFGSSHEEDITVLYIPDEIDGHPIVGIYDMYIESNCVTKIVYSSGIKTVCSWGLVPTGNIDCVPLCSIVLNEGLERISRYGGDARGASETKKTECPFLILPKSLSFIGENGIAADNFDNIILQSDPETDDCAITLQGDDSDQSCNVYLPNKVKKMSEKTFYKVFIDHTHELSAYYDFPENYFDDRVHVYGNGDSYPFPVEKYTENFWENIKETEKVTLDKSEVQLKAGRSKRINASIYPTDAYDGRVFYVSLDEEIASVDSEGKITAIKDGTATIRAVAASGAYADCKVTVGEVESIAAVIWICIGAAVLLITAYIVYRLRKKK